SSVEDGIKNNTIKVVKDYQNPIDIENNNRSIKETNDAHIINSTPSKADIEKKLISIKSDLKEKKERSSNNIREIEVNKYDLPIVSEHAKIVNYNPSKTDIKRKLISIKLNIKIFKYKVSDKRDKAPNIEYHDKESYYNRNSAYEYGSLVGFKENKRDIMDIRNIVDKLEYFKKKSKEIQAKNDNFDEEVVKYKENNYVNRRKNK
ncbi:4499_t:CDS:2, partial [Gigaspora margarita]